jgi:hypothetical protein
VLAAPSSSDATKPGPGRAKCRGIPGRIVFDFVPISSSLIRATNAWLTASCKHTTAVYAGHAPTPDGHDSDTGRFLILRENIAKGRETIDLVDLPGTGDTTLTAGPRGKKAEKLRVQRHGTLRFTTAVGQQGTLYLANDSAVLAPVLSSQR